MKKGYLVGGLAIVGAIALIAYLRKPKMNSEGFFNATGGKRKSTTLCVKRNSDGSSTSYSPQGGSRPCPYGGVVTTSKSMVLASPRIGR